MDVASPPKRMTRARAAKATTTAADASSSSSSSVAKKPTKSATTATGATKASAARAAAAASRKRKTRTDDDENDEESQPPAEDKTVAKATRPRGRPRKVVVTEVDPEPEAEAEAEPEPKAAAAAPRSTPGRAKKVVDYPKPEPVKTTRTRTKRASPGDDEQPESEPAAKKTARGRAAASTKKTVGTICTEPTTEPTPGLKSNISRPASRVAAAVKKSVTFQEPEKENLVPAPATKATAATKAKATKTETESVTGMRAKPVRKVATATTTTTTTSSRATRTSARTASTIEKKDKPAPLSPKKDAPNRPLSRASSDSDDELAGYDKTPVKPMMRSPVKPHRKMDISAPAAQEPTDANNDDDDLDELAGGPVLASPAKRPPSTPFKDAMMSPAKRGDGGFVPTLLFSKRGESDATQSSPLKTSVLQSPAKRPQRPIMALSAPSSDQEQQRSPTKLSFLKSPAKRPMSPFKASGARIPSTEEEPTVEEPVAEDPATEDSDTEDSDTGDSDTEEPTIEEAIAEEPITEEPPAEEPVTKGPTTEEPAAQEPVIEEPTADELAPEEPAIESSIEEPAAEDLDPQEPTVEEPIVEEQHKPEGDEEEMMEQQAEHEQETSQEQTEQVQPAIELAEQDEHIESKDVEMSREDEQSIESPTQLEFPGRLSAILPRHADPALQDRSSPSKAPEPLEPLVDDDQNQFTPEPEPVAATEKAASEDIMDVDAHSHEAKPESSTDENDNDEPEDELAASGKTPLKFQEDTTFTLADLPATPTPATSKTPRGALPSSAIKNASRAIRAMSRGSKLSFTPLSRQLGERRAESPSKAADGSVSGSPAKDTFEDEMRVRSEMQNGMESEMMAALEADLGADFPDQSFGDISITDEDIQLAAEASEMSLLEPEQMEVISEQPAHDDSISDASQEYGDENAVPIDPALFANGTVQPQPPVTPVRPSAMRTFNTTTKVPLKPSDESTPRTMKPRSASVSRLPPKQPTNPGKIASASSNSPTKASSEDDLMEQDENEEQPPVTPAKSDIWSAIGTPARTPRRDLNPALLRGAVVYVDVHTSEGADASTVFVELLTQMGARCVKSWPWNPNSTTEGESSTSKIGITHVVYKDGGKRTMEKVRQSGGVVQCVGVGWVLDCERENEWLDESPYYIDTTLVPRGGARRRKSMEPKALANQNGTLVTPVKQTSGAARECQTVPNNRMGRRDSTVWMHSPTNPEDEDMSTADDDDEWNSAGVLTPVPKTPAPEALHRYVTEMDMGPETPSAESRHGSPTKKQQMLMRTAPPKQNPFVDFGGLNKDSDQAVMMRLMAARRKSMQFAPKVASPLSKAWN